MRYLEGVSSQELSSQERFWVDMTNSLQAKILILSKEVR